MTTMRAPHSPTIRETSPKTRSSRSQRWENLTDENAETPKPGAKIPRALVVANEIARTFSDDRTGATCIADGYGLRVYVERGHLCVEDGLGQHRRRRRFSRATSELRRLITIGHSGAITFDALQWLHAKNAAWIQLSPDGQLVASSHQPGRDDARIRRAQAVAPERAVGTEISRSLLSAKLDGQLAVVDRLDASPSLRNQIEAARDRIESAARVDQMRAAEAAAAIAYWSAWSEVRCYFPQADQRRVPDHWHTFGRRRSTLTPTPRYATNPINAILNYLYGLLEAEARVGALVVGLDPGLGLIHTDAKNKAALALDLMEPARPAVDAYVLDLLAGRWFTANDFHENKQGNCRILPPLTHDLIESLPQWSKSVGPTIEAVVRSLATESPTKIGTLGTPLTETNRRGASRSRRTSQATKRPVRPITACGRCGGTTNSRTNKYCPDCLRERRLENTAAMNAGAQRQGRTATSETRQALSTTKQRRDLERRNWDDSPGASVEIDYEGSVVPLLAGVSSSALAAETGLSRSYCHQLIANAKVPHRRHWQGILEAATRLGMTATGH
jgi:CRISPR-associated endonuclease Cas1